MRRRSTASDQPAKSRRRKTQTPKRRSARKAKQAASPSASSAEAKIAQLTHERDDALEQQRAAAEVLKIISASPTEFRSVLEIIVKSAARFCDADDVTIFELDGQDLCLAAHRGPIPHEIGVRFPCTRGSVSGRSIIDRKAVHVIDLQAEVDEFPEGSAFARRFGHRTTACVPLLREGLAIGTIQLRRTEVNPFTDKQLALLGIFAAQAVIAIENARLFEEVRTKTRDLQEALVHQTGSANILKVIASSPTDVNPVLKAIVESACELCNADDAVVHLREKQDLQYGAHHGVLPVGFERHAISRDFVAGRSVVDKIPIHIHDVLSEEGDDFPEAQRMSRQAGLRTILSAPMLREGECIGAIVLRRKEVCPFTEKQIALLQTFADQAVIAIENVRLFDEVQAKTRDLEESLQQQTATSEVLQVISSSPGDLTPVFDKMLENAVRVCGAEFGTMNLVEGDSIRRAALYNVPAAFAAARTDRLYRTHPQGGLAAAIRTKQVVHITDLRTTPSYLERAITTVELVELGGARTIVVVPMLREAEVIGAITIYRQEVRPFADKQIELVSNFAKQAVIAIENTRLLRELRQRTADLSESLQQQTATSDVLKVIASSPTEVGPVLQAIVESACQLCESDDATVALKDGHDLVFKAQHGSIPIVWDRIPINRQMVTGRAIIDGQPVHVRDLYGPEGEGFLDAREFARQTDVRTVLSVPLLREGESIGVITLRRTEVEPFSDKQINLLQTFADQAVIAIGNVRLFDEVQAKTRDLEESLQQQTATSEVLQVISSSPGELEPVFQIMLENATRICGANFGTMYSYDGAFHLMASHNAPPALVEARMRTPVHLPPADTGLGRLERTKQVVHIHDITTESGYATDHAYVAGSKLSGARTILIVPMLKDAELVGSINIFRQEVRPFADKQIELLSNFARQAVIAIENARLLKELRQRTADLQESLQQQTATADVLKVISRSTVEL
jgi:GAF domain-containing protein